MPGRLDWGLAVASLVSAVAVGVTATVAVVSPFHPTSANPVGPPVELPVESVSFRDEHPVQLAVTMGAEQSVLSPVTGTVTASSCRAGLPLASGTSPLAVDGVPLLTLATEVPLWRDLTLGLRGDDVTALQTALAALGEKVDGSRGVFDHATLGAVRHRLSLVDAPPLADDVLPRQRILWLPPGGATVSKCPATVGSQTQTGAVVANLLPSVTTARVVALPASLTPGARELVVDTLLLHPSPQGVITSPKELAALAQAPALVGRAQPSDPLSGVYRLVKPVMAGVIPPSAIVGPDAQHTCVVSGNQAQRVTVLGSQLGQSYVTFEGTPPASVVVEPPRATPCT